MAEDQDQNQNPDPNQNQQPFNWDEEVASRDSIRKRKKLFWIVRRDWDTYSGTDATAEMRQLFGGRFTHLAFFPKKEEGRVYVVPADDTRKGAEEVSESRSRKTLRFNIVAGLDPFGLHHIKGTNMQFEVTAEEHTRYGKAMVVHVNTLEPVTIDSRGPRQKKTPTETQGEKTQATQAQAQHVQVPQPQAPHPQVQETPGQHTPEQQPAQAQQVPEQHPDRTAAGEQPEE